MRMPGAFGDEKNANELLIPKGAVPVDMNGTPIKDESKIDLKQQLKIILASKPLTERQIKNRLHLDIDTKQLSRLLSDMDFIISEKSKNRISFRLKNKEKPQGSLFE